jgi:hypothetical protein
MPRCIFVPPSLSAGQPATRPFVSAQIHDIKQEKFCCQGIRKINSVC